MIAAGLCRSRKGQYTGMSAREGTLPQSPEDAVQHEPIILALHAAAVVAGYFLFKTRQNKTRHDHPLPTSEGS